MIEDTVAAWYSSTRNLGYMIAFGVLGVPAYLIFATSIFGRPRNYRATLVFLGTVAAFALAFALAFPIMGAVLGIFIS